MGNGSRLSTDIGLGLVNWIGLLLVMRGARSLSLGLDSLGCSLLSKSLLISLREVLTSSVSRTIVNVANIAL